MVKKIVRKKIKKIVHKKIVDANEQQAASWLRTRKRNQIKAAEDRAYKRKQGKRSR